MIVLYADTSAIVGACFADEPDHDVLSEVLFAGEELVVTSELTRLEFAGAVAAAVRAERLDAAAEVLDRFDVDCGDGGPLSLLRLHPAEVLPAAYTMVGTHRLGTLDALHLAVAMTGAAGPRCGREVVTNCGR